MDSWLSSRWTCRKECARCPLHPTGDTVATARRPGSYRRCQCNRRRALESRNETAAFPNWDFAWRSAERSVTEKYEDGLPVPVVPVRHFSVRRDRWGLFTGRRRATMTQMDNQTKRALERGIDWLMSRQGDDGGWHSTTYGQLKDGAAV